MIRVVGLDLSLTATGIALPDGTVRRITSRVTGMPRLADIRAEVGALVVDPATTDLVAIEGYSFGSHMAHARSIGELGGVIRLWLYDLGVPYTDVPPKTLKKVATGNGAAGKEEVLAAAIRKLGYEGHDNNEADALWLRECALMAYGVQSDGVGRMVTKDQADALRKVEWPPIGDWQVAS